MINVWRLVLLYIQSDPIMPMSFYFTDITNLTTLFLMLWISKVIAFQSREELINAIVNPVNPQYIREEGKGLFDRMDPAHYEKKQFVAPINGTNNVGEF